MKGIPKEAATAIKMAVDGAGSIPAAKGINIVTDAVLLINADIVALTKHKANNRAGVGICCQGIEPLASLIVPDCSNKLPSAIPPAISRSVDQSIRAKS